MNWLNELAGGDVGATRYSEDVIELFELYGSIEEVLDGVSRSLERYVALKGMQVRTRGELDIFTEKIESFIRDVMKEFDVDRVRAAVRYILSTEGDDGQYIIHLAAAKGYLKKAKYIVNSRGVSVLESDCELGFGVRCEACALLISAVKSVLYSYARYAEEFNGFWSDVDSSIRDRIRASLGAVIIQKG